MIMNNKKQFTDGSVWERVEQKIKQWTYTLMHELLQSQICSPFLFKLLILVETLQLLFYSIHPRLDGFLWTTVFLEYFRQMIQYFQINSILEGGAQQVFLVILYFIFTINFLMLILLILTTHKISSSQRKSSTFLTYGIKLLSSYGLLMNTIITIPFFNIFVAAIYCQEDSQISENLECYQGIYFLHLAIALFGLLIQVIFSLLFTVLYIDLNPNSQIPFAAPQSKTNLIRLLLKFFLPLYVTVDYNGNLAAEFITILCIFYLFLQVQRFRTPPCYNKSVYNFQIVCDTTLFWISFCGVIHAFIDIGEVDNIGLFYAVLGIPLTALVYKMLINQRNSTYMRMINKQFKKDTDIEMYINIMIDLIEGRDFPEQRIKLEGILKYHHRNCTKLETCQCQKIIRNEQQNANQNKEEDQNAQARKWYLFLNSILNEGLDKFPKSSKLHLLHSHIQHEKLKNKFKALFELMITEESKPNIQEEFSIYRYKNQIEEEMQEQDNRNTESKGGVDVNVLVHFQSKLVIFQAAIEKSVNLHLEFWRELLEDNPDIQKLQSLGSKITNTVETTTQLFKKLQELNPNHIKCLEIYGNYLKEIVNDDQEGQRIIDKATQVSNSASLNKQFVDNERLKYGENSNTCIVTCSGNYNSVGVVTNSNNEITRILGYNKSDIIDQNIQRIMPKVIADLHDSFMRKYLETSEGNVINTERLVLCQNKQGYLVPCSLMIKVLPDLLEGISIVGFLKDIETQQNMLKSSYETEEQVHYMIYNVGTEVILGVTYSCYQNLGIPASLVYGNSQNTNEFTIDQIAPDINDAKNLEDLRSPQGLVAQMDTTYIQTNFLLDEEQSDNESERDDADQQNSEQHTKLNFGKNQNKDNTIQTENLVENQQLNANQIVGEETVIKKSKFKKTKIRANLAEELTWDKTTIRIIKFVEVDDSENEGDNM